MYDEGLLFSINLPYSISMFLLVISVNHTNTIWKVPIRVQLMEKSTRTLMEFLFNLLPLSKPGIISYMGKQIEVNCIKTYSDGVQLELLSVKAHHIRSSNVFIQLTHSMLPLSLLILSCYTCSIYRIPLDKSIATYKGYMSRDNGSEICNIECISTP